MAEVEDGNQLTAEEEEVYRRVKEKMKKQKKKIKLEEDQFQQQEMELGEKTLEQSDEKEKRKKKKKKHKIKLEEVEEDEQQQQQQHQEMELDEKTQLMEESNEREKRKKKKKKKIKLDDEQLQQEEMELEEKTQLIEEHNEKGKRNSEDTIDEQHEIPLEEVRVEEEEEEEEEEVIVEEVNARVEVVGKNEDKFAPVVCYYSSGFNPQRMRKKKKSGVEEDDDGIEVKTVRTETRVEVVVTPKDYKVDFVGESHSGEPANSQVCSYSLAVFDKESQTLQIIPVAANKILRLEPKFRTSSVCDEEPLKGLKEEDQSPAKLALARRNLLKIYGTKTANIVATKLDILNRPEDAETQKSIDEKTQNVKLNKKALATASGAPTRNIPPHDSTADTPEKAYPIDRIILPGEWDSLRDILELVQSEADIAPNSYPSFVCNRMHKLLEIQDEEERKKQARILSYITHLIKFKDQWSVDRHSFSRNHWIPAILNNKFKSMFEDSDKKPSPEKINLLVSYVLVLTLIADGYKTDTVDIAKDLKMTVRDLRDHCINLGCKLKQENKVFVFTLPTPLDLPKPKMQRQKRKR